MHRTRRSQIYICARLQYKKSFIFSMQNSMDSDALASGLASQYALIPPLIIFVYINSSSVP